MARQLDSEDLVALGRQFERWRRLHGGRGRRIPEELWRSAARVARSRGVDAVARTLRLRRERLAAFVAEGGKHEPEEVVEFVEVRLAPTASSASSDTPAVLVQFETEDGRRLRLEVPTASPCNVGAIFDAFVGS
jgi:hypothetical protein